MVRLSYGALTAYISCPRRYEAVYVFGMKRPTTGREHRGSAVHAAIEEYLRAGGLSDELLVNSLRHHFSANTDGVDWERLQPTELLAEAEKGIILYKEILDQLRPAPDAIEVQFERQLTPDILLVGRVDAVMTNSTIVDHKSGGKSPAPWDVPLSLQPTVYAIGLELLGDPVHAAFGWMVFLKSKPPKIELHTTERSRADIDWVQNILIPQVAESIDAGRFPPRPAWHCSSCFVRQTFCGYRKDWSP